MAVPIRGRLVAADRTVYRAVRVGQYDAEGRRSTAGAYIRREYVNASTGALQLETGLSAQVLDRPPGLAELHTLTGIPKRYILGYEAMAVERIVEYGDTVGVELRVEHTPTSRSGSHVTIVGFPDPIAERNQAYEFAERFLDGLSVLAVIYRGVK